MFFNKKMTPTFIEVYDNALSKSKCEKIIKEFDKSGYRQNEGCLFREGKIILAPESKKSTDIEYSFSDDEYVPKILYSALCDGLNKYRKKYDVLSTRVSSWRISERFNVQKYNPGEGYIEPHCENGGGSDLKRNLVWMFYLNTVTDKGGTKFPQYDLVTDAVEGRLVIWPAYFTHVHHGIPSPSQTKYIATGWTVYV
jgi:hypothetical protein